MADDPYLATQLRVRVWRNLSELRVGHPFQLPHMKPYRMAESEKVI